ERGRRQRRWFRSFLRLFFPILYRPLLSLSDADFRRLRGPIPVPPTPRSASPVASPARGTVRSRRRPTLIPHQVRFSPRFSSNAEGGTRIGRPGGYLCCFRSEGIALCVGKSGSADG
ncbi:unnamed protein product, partial [Musa acuminata subsp. burmannicoides]